MPQIHRLETPPSRRLIKIIKLPTHRNRAKQTQMEPLLQLQTARKSRFDTELMQALTARRLVMAMLLSNWTVLGLSGGAANGQQAATQQSLNQQQRDNQRLSQNGQGEQQVPFSPNQSNTRAPTTNKGANVNGQISRLGRCSKYVKYRWRRDSDWVVACRNGNQWDRTRCIRSSRCQRHRFRERGKRGE